MEAPEVQCLLVDEVKQITTRYLGSKTDGSNLLYTRTENHAALPVTLLIRSHFVAICQIGQNTVHVNSMSG